MLRGDFLIDLIKACVVSPNILNTVQQHLKYSYLPTETHKRLFKCMFDHYTEHAKSPTLGILAQNCRDQESLSIIDAVRQTNIYDNKDQIIGTLEDYIKRNQFVELHLKTEELYNQGKHEQAIQFLSEQSQLITNFSLRSKLPARIYADFPQRQLRRTEKDYTLKKVPTGIPQFDYHTHGGTDKGTGLLGIGRSGAGKTTLLRSCGHHASFRGLNVLHISCGDSTQEEIEDGYDAMWTGVPTYSLREGDFLGVNLEQIEKARQQFLALCGEIYVHVYKGFSQASIGDSRQLLIDVMKEHKIDVVLWDYLEKFAPGNGRRYAETDDSNRLKKQHVAEAIINVCTELDVAGFTVTQASEVPIDVWNNPEKYLTRSNISNLKATIDPFAYCITLNQTEDEDDNEIMRIHEEKMRHYKVPSWARTYCIKQDRDHGKFIDVAATNRLFWDNEQKKHRKTQNLK